MPYAIAWEILLKIINFFHYKISHIKQLRDRNEQTKLEFVLQFIARMEVECALL